VTENDLDFGTEVQSFDLPIPFPYMFSSFSAPIILILLVIMLLPGLLGIEQDEQYFGSHTT
jgi:hypothetical protein